MEHNRLNEETTCLPTSSESNPIADVVSGADSFLLQVIMTIALPALAWQVKEVVEQRNPRKHSVLVNQDNGNKRCGQPIKQRADSKIEEVQHLAEQGQPSSWQSRQRSRRCLPQ